MSNIYKIKDKELNDFISYNNTNKVILYYKQNCIFCKAEIEDLNKLVKIYNNNIDYAICDVTNCKKFCLNQDIIRVPVIQIYKDLKLVNQIVARQPYDVLEKEINNINCNEALNENEFNNITGRDANDTIYVDGLEAKSPYSNIPKEGIDDKQTFE